MAKKNSRDLFKQMNSNVRILEETDKSPILNTENAPEVKTEDNASSGRKEVTETKSRNTEKKKAEEQMVKKNTRKPAGIEENPAFEETDSLEKKDSNLIRITYNLTYDLNEKFNSFTKQYELYKTSLIKALMEGWLDGSIELDENEVLFNDGLIKIKKKAGSRKAVGSILVSAELDNAFTKKCHETEIEKNNCIFRLLKTYLEQKMPDGKL
ncbi:MAG: hypothetical protein K2N95_15355 [Lachnospiraceae bacterium]|nr:hypothetical protein [Lachnospiraceae bacterium]